MGLMTFSRKAMEDLFGLLEANGDFDIYKLDMTKAINIVLKRNLFKVMGIAYCEHWGEVDTQKRLKPIQKPLKNLINNLETSLKTF